MLLFCEKQNYIKMENIDSFFFISFQNTENHLELCSLQNFSSFIRWVYELVTSNVTGIVPFEYVAVIIVFLTFYTKFISNWKELFVENWQNLRI